jgi:hypothetical protein
MAGLDDVKKSEFWTLLGLEIRLILSAVLLPGVESVYKRNEHQESDLEYRGG